MTTRLFLLLSLICGLLQGPFLPGVFFEGLLVILLIFSRGLKRSLPFLFLAGILFDLASLRTLGSSSLIFITLGGVSWFLRNHITPERGIFLTASVLAISITRSHFVFNSVSPLNIAVILVISLVTFNVLQPLLGRTKGFEI